MQETKLADADVPVDVFRDAGYELAHHGEGRWNGVAIASRVGIADVVTNFGEPLRPGQDRGRGRRRAAGRGPDDLGVVRRRPGRLRLRAQRPDRRLHLLRGQARLVRPPRPLARRGGRDPSEPLVLGGDLNVAPADIDVWDPRGLPRRHARLGAGAEGLRAPPASGASSTSTASSIRSPSATPGGTTAPATSTRTTGCASTTCSCRRPVAARVVWTEIDRETRKGKPTPSDHTPLVIDLDERGLHFDAGWASAEGRIAARRPR